MTRVPYVPIEELARVINEYGTCTRHAAGEEHQPRPALRDLGDDVATLAEVEPSTVQLQRAADALHPVFVAAQERADPAAILNDLLVATRPTPTSDAHGCIEWTVATPDDAVLAALTIALLRWTDQHGIDSLGICDANRCVDVYLDTSERRRFCSTTCLTRTKVAAYRERQAQKATADGEDAVI